MPAGRPSKYSPAYADEVITYCAEGYSLTAFAGSIGVCRDTITEWCAEHEDFSLAVKRAKAKRAMWWEERAKDVAAKGGPGGQATMVIFGLKNHAPEDYQDIQRREHTGKDGGPIETSELTPEEKAKRARQILAETFAAVKDQ